MDDPDSFKTIDCQSVRPQNGSQNSQGLSSRPGHHWCLQQAVLITSCYRRDEAHEPEAFAQALALVLSDYPIEIIKYVVDPRTGIANAFPMGLPNVGQIKEFCDGVQSRQARIERYATLPRGPSRPIEAPPLAPGQVSYTEFLAMARRGEVKRKPIGRFDQVPAE